MSTDSSQSLLIPGFGDRMKTAFGGKNNAQIATEMKITPTAVGNYIKGKITLPVVFEISRLTGRSVGWLLTDEGDEFIDGNKQVNLDATFRSVVREIVNEVLAEKKNGKPRNKLPKEPVEISNALHFDNKGRGKSKVKPENLARDRERSKNDPTNDM